METGLLHTHNYMNSLTSISKLRPLLSSSSSSSSYSKFVSLSSLSLSLTPNPSSSSSSSSSSRVSAKLLVDAPKESWLDSLSCPLLPPAAEEEPTPPIAAADSTWVVGIDPDLSGALALLKTDSSGCSSAQVFDSPHLPVRVGNRVRKRLDPRSIVQLLRTLDAPIGTAAYIEQSIPFPKDGKQGWWSGGFGYGLWIGILVASGYSVVPVPSFVWKKDFELVGAGSVKDDSRRIASTLFPSLSDQLKRKKDHGRAEALLIAAYGKGLRAKADSSLVMENLVP